LSDKDPPAGHLARDTAIHSAVQSSWEVHQSRKTRTIRHCPVESVPVMKTHDPCASGCVPRGPRLGTGRPRGVSEPLSEAASPDVQSSVRPRNDQRADRGAYPLGHASTCAVSRAIQTDGRRRSDPGVAGLAKRSPPARKAPG
jgi:hypothetical protein